MVFQEKFYFTFPFEKLTMLIVRLWTTIHKRLEATEIMKSSDVATFLGESVPHTYMYINIFI